MDEETMGIKSVRVEYISTKTDKYNNEIGYFKMRYKSVDSKFATLMKPSYILPWFKSDKGHYILKVKTKYCKMKELKKEETALVDVTFKYCKMNDIQGYYVSSIA